MPGMAALVPMRHHSQRVPEKNFRMLAGKPLFHHILDTLQSVPELEGIFVDTDSPVISAGIRKAFPNVQIIDRPQELTADDISMNRILAHDVSLIKSDYYLQTHSTNPLLSPDTISAAIRTFLESQENHDSLFSVTRLQTRLYNSAGEALNHDPAQLLQTQDLPPVFEENSCLYIFSEASLLRNKHRIGESPLMFEIDPDQAWDIDNPLDFDIVDFLVSHSRK